MKNPYEVRGETTAIMISTDRVECGYVEALVDTDQLDRLLEIHNTWGLAVSRRGPSYVRSQIAKRHVKIHRFLTCADDDYEVHHINRDAMDNRLANLRVISKGDHRRIHALDATGVSFDTRRGRYSAQIHINDRHYSLGFYETSEEASAARHAANIVKSILLPIGESGSGIPAVSGHLAAQRAVSPVRDGGISASGVQMTADVCQHSSSTSPSTGEL